MTNEASNGAWTQREGIDRVLDESRDRLQAECSDLRRRLGKTTDALIEAKHERDEAVERFETARRELSRAQEAQSRLSAELATLQSEKASLLSDLKAARAGVDGVASEKEQQQSALQRARAEKEEALRRLGAANAARELTENRERALRRRKEESESRGRALEDRVNELLVQLGETEKETEGLRGAMKDVEAAVRTVLSAVRRRRTRTHRNGEPGQAIKHTTMPG